ncbi:hypothetical protein GOP47_0026795 [Adiantum capillus-veneris]|nr:hypothetical protein GOP47_0026795 [Adiantum capillus-veneris]
MVSFKLQKRLVASVLKCGKCKVWLDPNEVNGNLFKNKRVLKSIHKSKAEKVHEKTLSNQFETRRAKEKSIKERKSARWEERLDSD